MVRLVSEQLMVICGMVRYSKTRLFCLETGFQRIHLLCDSRSLSGQLVIWTDVFVDKFLCTASAMQGIVSLFRYC